MKRRTFLLGASIAVLALPMPVLAEPIHATLYKNPQCTCCEGYAANLRQSGFAVDVKPTNDLAEISSKAGVPEKLQGCHTMLVNGYVVDGHVPIKTVKKLLDERPDIKGIALPGMPMGSPGMTGRKTELFTIYEIATDMPDPPRVYAVE